MSSIQRKAIGKKFAALVIVMHDVRKQYKVSENNHHNFCELFHRTYRFYRRVRIAGSALPMMPLIEFV